MLICLSVGVFITDELEKLVFVVLLIGAPLVQAFKSLLDVVFMLRNELLEVLVLLHQFGVLDKVFIFFVHHILFKIKFFLLENQSLLESSADVKVRDLQILFVNRSATKCGCSLFLFELLIIY